MFDELKHCPAKAGTLNTCYWRIQHEKGIRSFSYACLDSISFTAQSPSKDIILIKAGRLIDVRNGKPLTDQAILIEGDRIKEVGPSQAVSSHAPAGARVLDLSNSTVLPGLIDCHTHLTFAFFAP